eukprot:2135892-Alexandrium_andersonii.AAC.1
MLGRPSGPGFKSEASPRLLWRRRDSTPGAPSAAGSRKERQGASGVRVLPSSLTNNSEQVSCPALLPARPWAPLE